jgi:predicted PurR-regulated permease PerM
MTGNDQSTKRVLIAASIAALVVAGWWPSEVFIIIFGGLIRAIALCAAAGSLTRFARVPERVALAVVVVSVVALLALLFWLAGERVGTQFAELRTTLPKAFETASQWLDASALGPTVRDLFDTAKEGGVP